MVPDNPSQNPLGQEPQQPNPKPNFVQQYSENNHTPNAVTLPADLQKSAGRSRAAITFWLIGLVVGIWALWITLLLTGHVGPKTATVGLAYNSGNYSQCAYALAKQTFVPSPVYNAFAGVAGKDVPAGKLVLALAVIALAVIVVITLVSNAVYSSIISLGRNPLASHRIVVALTEALAFSLVILIISAAIIFVTLRL